VKDANVTAARIEIPAPNVGTLAEMNFAMVANRVLAAGSAESLFLRLCGSGSEMQV
jgi:hypothetical protein